MAVLLSDIKQYAAAVTPEDDSTTAIGGAIDLTKKYLESDFTGVWQIVSSAAGDTTQTLTLHYRNTLGAILNVVKALNGTTLVTDATSIERVMKVVKSATTTGDCALMSQTAENTGTLQGLGVAADEVVLAVGASAVDGAYTGMVFRATGGTGANAICQILQYNGTTKVAVLSRNVSATFNGTTTYSIAKGVFFDKTPSEIMYVVRMDYNTIANPFGGASEDTYTKGFFKHTNASGSGLNLTGCVVKEIADPQATMTFAIGTALNDTQTNGGGNNRNVAPGAGVTTFDNGDKNVPSGGVMAPNDTIAFWPKMTRAAGSEALKTTWTPGFTGSST
jgi:hypothetical protein